jgi:hypothetical protein
MTPIYIFLIITFVLLALLAQMIFYIAWARKENEFYGVHSEVEP